jgi:hypothetical protein
MELKGGPAQTRKAVYQQIQFADALTPDEKKELKKFLSLVPGNSPIFAVARELSASSVLK